MIPEFSMNETSPDIVRPHPNLKGQYLTYLLILVWIGILPWLLPLAFLVPPILTLLISSGLFALVCLYTLWVRWYYRSMIFCLEPEGISWRRGVLFTKSGFVPYKDISDIEIKRGPVSRIFGLSSVQIRTTTGNTAAPSARVLRIPGIIDPLVLKERLQYSGKQASDRFKDGYIT